MLDTIDRRAARTRKALYDALISLILRKGYEAITIQDLIDEADVGRSTFYAHYTSKEDLLRSGFDTLRKLLTEAQRDSRARGGDAQRFSFSLAMFEHACQYRTVYKALIGGRGGPVIGNELRHVLSDAVRKDLAAAADDGAIPRELRVQFVVGTFMNVLIWCLEQKSGIAPPQMDVMFRRLVLNGLALPKGKSVGFAD